MSRRTRDEQREYLRIHKMVRETRGSASEQICITCGQQAYDWSQILGTNGTDPTHYQPQCRKCHFHYDGRIEKLSIAIRKISRRPEARVAAAEKQREVWQRPGVREQMSAALTGRKMSTETKLKMSEAVSRRYLDPENRSKTASATRAARGTTESRAKTSAQMQTIWDDPKKREARLTKHRCPHCEYEAINTALGRHINKHHRDNDE